MADTRTVYHPVFRNVTRVVPAENEQEWKNAGWRFTPIPKDKPAVADPDGASE